MSFTENLISAHKMREREQKTEQTYNRNLQLVTVHVTDIDQLNTLITIVIAIANLSLSLMLVRQAKIDFRSSHLVFCGGLQQIS